MNEIILLDDDPDDVCTAPEPQQTLFWLEKHAARGDPAAQLELSKAYEEGLLTGRYVSDAIVWENRSAQQDYAPAIVSQAARWLAGRHASQNTRRALDRFDDLMEVSDGRRRRFHAGLILDCARAFHESVPGNDAAAYLTAFHLMQSSSAEPAQRRAAEALIAELQPRAFIDGAEIRYDFADQVMGLAGPRNGGLHGLRPVRADRLEMPAPARPHDTKTLRGVPPFRL